MKREGMGLTKTANAMSRRAAKVDKDYLRREILIHESNFSDQNQYWSFTNVLMHARNDLKLDKPHEMGACILTFESINKDNPLATNANIALLYEKWLRVESSSTNSYIARARHCPSKTYFE